MKNRKIPFWWLVLVSMIVSILAQAIHEGGHWVVYQAAGHRPIWAFTSLVQTWGVPPQRIEGWVETTAPDGERGWLKLTSVPNKAVEGASLAAGPIASLVSAVIGLLVYRFVRSPAARMSGLILAITTGFIMTMYYARSGLRTGGDEGFLAALLGVSKLVFDIPLGLAFAACFLIGLWALKTWKNRLRWLGAILLGSIPPGGLMVMFDPFIRSGVSEGNPWFQSVLGFSLPVFVVYCLAVVGLIWLGSILSHLEGDPFDRSGCVATK
ncbi:MAG: hypothetical protein JXB07_11900 [Anaerolineae bacterium]|nr:hypothetical protein [Anaerolineae bacterium]